MGACPVPNNLYIYRRPLRYPSQWPNGGGAPQEKGVDVALAVDLVQLTYQGGFDIAVVCSHDTDLSPALATSYEQLRPRVCISRLHHGLAEIASRTRVIRTSRAVTD